MTLDFTNSAIKIHASIPKNLTCILVKPAQPAEYQCDPILSQLEEDTLVEPEYMAYPPATPADTGEIIDVEA